MSMSNELINIIWHTPNDTMLYFHAPARYVGRRANISSCMKKVYLKDCKFIPQSMRGWEENDVAQIIYSSMNFCVSELTASSDA